MSEDLNGLKEGLTDKEKKVVFIPGVLEKFKNHIKQVFSDAELIENFDKEISFLKENKYIGKYFTFPDIDSLNYYVNVENDFRRKVFVNIGNVFLGIEMIVKIEEVMSSSKKLEIDEPIDDALDKIFKFLSKKTKLPVNEDVIYLWYVYHKNGWIGKIRRLWKKSKDSGLVIDNIENRKTGKFNKESIKLADGVYVIDNSFFNVISPFFDLVNTFMKLVKEYTGVDDDKLKLFFLLQKDYKGWIILDLFYKNYLKLDNKNKSLLLSFIYNWLDFVDFVNDIIDVYDVSNSKKEIPENIYLVEGEKILEFYKKFKVRIDDLEKEIALSKEVSEEDFRLLERFFKSREDVEFFKEKGWFEKISSYNDSDKEDFIILFNSYRSFFKKYSNLVRILKISDLKILFELKDYGFADKQLILMLEKGLLKEENLTVLKNLKPFLENLFDYPNELLHRIIFELPPDVIEFIASKKIDKDFVENYILEHKNETGLRNMVSAAYEVYSYRKYFFSQIQYLPSQYSVKEEITEWINRINILNAFSCDFEKKKIGELISKHENVIKRVSDLVGLGYTLKEIEKIYDILLSKRIKKNKLKLSNVLDIVEYVLKNFNKQDAESFFYIILSDSKVIVDKNFLENYESVIKSIIENIDLVKIFLSDKEGNISLSRIKEYLFTKQMDQIKEDLISELFPENFHQEVEELKNNQDFNDLIKIAKIFDLKNEDENLVLDLIVMDNKKVFLDFVRFVVIYIKSDIRNKFKEIFGMFTYLSETGKDFSKEIPVDFGETMKNYDSDIKYWWLNEFIYGSLGPEFFFKEEDFEEENEKKSLNKGLNRLAGFSGKEILNKLKKLGFEEKRVNGKIQGKGDHVLLFREKDSKKQYFLVPMHRQVKASTLGDKLKMVGISKDEFLNA